MGTILGPYLGSWHTVSGGTRRLTITLTGSNLVVVTRMHHTSGGKEYSTLNTLQR